MPKFNEEYFAEIAKEYTKEGKLSEATVKKLEEDGFSKGIVENYLNYSNSHARLKQIDLMNSTGLNKEQLQGLEEYISANFNESEQAELKADIEGGGLRAKMAMKALVGDYKASDSFKAAEKPAETEEASNKGPSQGETNAPDEKPSETPKDASNGSIFGFPRVATGNTPRVTTPPGVKPFSTQSEMDEAINSPKYSQDASFAKEVDSRIMVTPDFE